MKRFISILLAIMLVATLLPTAVFAEEGEAESTGIRIKYDLQGVVEKLGLAWESSSTEASAVKRVPFSVMDFKASDGFFSFNASSQGLFTAHSELNYNAVIGFQISSGDWIAFDIFVPKAGTYTMEMWCGNYWKDTKTEVYIDGEYVGRYSNYEEGTVEKNATEGQVNQFTKVVDEPRYVEGIVFEEAGLHTIKFATNGTYGTVGTFYLIENGEETENCLATIVADIDRDTLSCGTGETAAISTSLFMADGSAVEDKSAYPVSFRSDNEAVANVSEDGVVTPGAVGKANIAAYTTNEFGEEVCAIKEIYVVDGATIKYDVTKHLYTDLGYKSSTAVADGSLDKLDEVLTNGFYSYAGGKAYDANYVKYYARVQLMGNGTAMAFKINVPVAGLYGIEIDTLSKTPARCDVDMDVYITTGEKSAYPKDKAGSYNVYNPDVKDGTAIKKYICSYNFEEPGEYIINFVIGTPYQPEAGNPYSYVGSFYLVGGTKSALMNGKITSTTSSINVDENETATVSATGYLSSTTEAATFTYSSSNEKVATVDEESGVVTPVAEGVAIITATANADLANTLATEIEVT
ncbi:MAG: Ig-like domain-containing protein, partial [Oscillospiraceae bacterium]|nr:Ig-like domain-containing protein [Oscillospiraceae bacterium]